MLYNRKWDKPSVLTMLLFCESKPADEAYNFMDACNCACAQSLGKRRVLIFCLALKDFFNLLDQRLGDWTAFVIGFQELYTQFPDFVIMWHGYSLSHCYHCGIADNGRGVQLHL